MAVYIEKFLRKGFSIIKTYHSHSKTFHHSDVHFRPVRSDISYNNLTNFRYALSSALLNDLLYVLLDIIYHTDNPFCVRRIITDNCSTHVPTRFNDTKTLSVAFRISKCLRKGFSIIKTYHSHSNSFHQSNVQF